MADHSVLSESNFVRWYADKQSLCSDSSALRRRIHTWRTNADVCAIAHTGDRWSGRNLNQTQNIEIHYASEVWWWDAGEWYRYVVRHWFVVLVCAHSSRFVYWSSAPPAWSCTIQCQRPAQANLSAGCSWREFRWIQCKLTMWSIARIGETLYFIYSFCVKRDS